MSRVCQFLNIFTGRQTYLTEPKCRHYIYQTLKALDHMHRLVTKYFFRKNVKNTHGRVLLLVKVKPATLLKVTLSMGIFHVF